MDSLAVHTHAHELNYSSVPINVHEIYIELNMIYVRFIQNELFIVPVVSLSGVQSSYFISNSGLNYESRIDPRNCIIRPLERRE